MTFFFLWGEGGAPPFFLSYSRGRLLWTDFMVDLLGGNFSVSISNTL